MKKLFFLFSIFISLNIFGQDINGVWADSCSSSFTNPTAVFAIKNDSVFMTHYVEFNGHPFVEHGIGTIKGNQLHYKVFVTVQVPDWTTTQGEHVLTLSEDGNTLRGYFKDNSGNSGPIVFKRKLPISKNLNGTKLD